MPSHSRTARIGFWPSVAILAGGAFLLAGVVARALLLEAALVTDRQGVDAYASADRATGGVVPSLPFLAALGLYPAYVLQIASLQGLGPSPDRTRAWLGVVLVLVFALLAGLNHGVQVTAVRLGLLAGQSA